MICLLPPRPRHCLEEEVANDEEDDKDNGDEDNDNDVDTATANDCNEDMPPLLGGSFWWHWRKWG